MKIGNSRRKGWITVKNYAKIELALKKSQDGFNLNSIFQTTNLIVCLYENRTIKILINHNLGAFDQRSFIIYVYSLFKIIDWNYLTVQCHFNSLVILINIANTIYKQFFNYSICNRWRFTNSRLSRMFLSIHQKCTL